MVMYVFQGPYVLLQYFFTVHEYANLYSLAFVLVFQTYTLENRITL